MKRLIFALIPFFTLLLCGCNAQQASESQPSSMPEEVIHQIDGEALKSMKYVVENATEDNVSAIVRDEGGSFYVLVSLDPVVLKYQYAMALEPVVAAVRTELEASGESLSSFEFAGFFYKDGDVYNTMVWKTSDLETGEFASPMDGKVGIMSIAEVYDFCEYTPGG